MARPLCALLLAAFLVPAASAQRPDPLPGEYYNISSNARCAVTRTADGYVFENESGARAHFRFIAFDTLAVAESPSWDPNTRAYPQRDGFGRIVIVFKAPGRSPEAWASAR
ncbi:MAG: hypothetical protein K2W96_06960 [Gemmataceae bacterium]|nr:hypothetical protein [Gemmataceae bacterium]